MEPPEKPIASETNEAKLKILATKLGYAHKLKLLAYQEWKQCLQLLELGKITVGSVRYSKFMILERCVSHRF